MTGGVGACAVLVLCNTHHALWKPMCHPGALQPAIQLPCRNFDHACAALVLLATNPLRDRNANAAKYIRNTTTRMQ